VTYADSSVIVKRYYEEAGTGRVRELFAPAERIFTSRLAYAEVHAALARKRRERAISEAAYQRSASAFEADWPAYLSVEVTSALCRQAGDLAERYRLRACDSIHLAAFAEVVREAGVRDTRFSSFDAALNRAARSLRRTLTRPGER